MSNLLDKFDDIKIDNDNRIDEADQNFCKIQEKLYILSHTVYSNVLKELKNTLEIQNKEFDILKQNGKVKDHNKYSFCYIDDYGDCGIHKIEDAIVQTTGKFISRIVYYFSNKYMLKLNDNNKYDGFNHYHDNVSKLDIITLEYVLETYIFSQLDGCTFIEKAIQQIKKKARMPLQWYNYRKYWNYEIKGKTIKFKTNIDDIQPALYFYDNNETKIINCYSFQKVEDFKSYDNGNTDIKFVNASYALDFAKRYLGYIEMTEEEREQYKKKCGNW